MTRLHAPEQRRTEGQFSELNHTSICGRINSRARFIKLDHQENHRANEAVTRPYSGCVCSFRVHHCQVFRHHRWIPRSAHGSCHARCPSTDSCCWQLSSQRRGNVWTTDSRRRRAAIRYATGIQSIHRVSASLFNCGLGFWMLPIRCHSPAGIGYDNSGFRKLLC